MIKNVLGVRIDDLSEGGAIEQVTLWLKDHSSTSSKLSAIKLVFTPGPEFLVEAKRDLEFKKILNGSDLNIPDGFGLKFAGVKNRIPGFDFMLDLCQEAEKNGWTVGLFGGWSGETQETASKLLRLFPKLNISLRIDGEEADQMAAKYINREELKENQDTQRVREVERNRGREDGLKKISLPAVEILFVAMGHFRQEKLLYNLKLAKKEQKSSEKNFLNFKVGMGVGSSFDEITGRAKTGPKWLSKVGLKWLGRLAHNPKHLRRVLTATFTYFWFLLSK